MSLLKFLGKKQNKESPSPFVNPLSTKLVIKKFNKADLEALKFNGQNIKVLNKSKTATGKGSGKKQNVFIIPMKQFGIKKRELLGMNPNKLIKSSTRGSSQVNYLESCTSLTLTTKQNNYNTRKVGKRSLRSVGSSSSRTLTIKCKKSSKLLIPKSMYNNILMNSIPSKIIDSNIENPVFVPIKSIWKRNSSDNNNENKPGANIVPVRSSKGKKRTAYSNMKNPQIFPEGSIGEKKPEAYSPSEPKNYIRPELLRDLEIKTKLIPDIMEKVKSIEDQLNTISTKQIKELDPEHDLLNKSVPMSTQLKKSPILDRHHVQKSKVHMASKRNKRTKGQRHKIREQSASLSRQNQFTSASKSLNFVFGPKAREFTSSTFAAPIQTSIPHSTPHASCSKSKQNVTSTPVQDPKISQSQGDCESCENHWEGLFKGAAFANILSGKDMMQLLQQFQNNFSLPSNSGELYLVDESQNLQRFEKSATTKSASVIGKNQANDNEVAGNLNNTSRKSVGCEHFKESPSTSKVLRNEEIFEPNKFMTKNIMSDLVKPDTDCEDQQQLPEPEKKNNNTKENAFKWLNGYTNNENHPELSITVQLKDGNKSVTFESSTPKILELPQSGELGERSNSLVDNYVNAVKRSKVQPISTRSILTSPRNYDEHEKEETRFTSMENLIAEKSFEFDYAGEGDVPCPITKAGMRNFEEEKIKFVSEEKDFLLGESLGYLDRNKRAVLEDKLRSITSFSNVRSPYPKTTFAHFMADEVEDSKPEKKTLNFNNCDCAGSMNCESGLKAPICDYLVDEDCAKYTNNINIEDSLNMNRYSKIYTFTGDSDKDSTIKLDSTVRFRRRTFTKLECIQEVSEPESEDKLTMVDNTDEETEMEIISTKSSVSVQTDLELIDISFDWALLFYRLASVINLNKPHVEDQIEFMRLVTESASVSKGEVDHVDLPQFFEASSELNILDRKSLKINRTLSKSHVLDEHPDEGKKFEIDSKVRVKKYEMSKLEDIEESEEEYLNSFEPLTLLGVSSDGPVCEIKESTTFLSGKEPTAYNRLFNGGDEPNKEAENNKYTGEKEIPRMEKSQESSNKGESFTKHVCSNWCFCPTTDDDEVLNYDLDFETDYYLFSEEIEPNVELVGDSKKI